MEGVAGAAPACESGGVWRSWILLALVALGACGTSDATAPASRPPYGPVLSAPNKPCGPQETDLALGVTTTDVYKVCAPSCVAQAPCPAAPSGVGATPVCWATKLCVLGCTVATQCPAGARCVALDAQTTACMYPK